MSSDAAPSPGILAIFNNVAPGREAEFDAWFQHEHLAERIAVPGFLLGRRHEAVAAEPRYFNFYVTTSSAILKSPAYLERLDHPTPMTRTVMSEIFKDMIRTACDRVFRRGVTMEVRRDGRIVQCRGFANRGPYANEAAMAQRWARAHGLTWALGEW